MVRPGWHGYVLLICLSVGFVGVDSFLGNLPPPVNLNLSWGQNTLSIWGIWRRPAGLDRTCKVNYTLAIYNEKCPPKTKPTTKLRTGSLNITYNLSKEDEICVGISTNPMVCKNKIASKEVYKDLHPPLALVKNFRCAYYANKKMNCTWTVVKNTPDLRLFYRVHQSNALYSCISYITSGSKKTGCHLHDGYLTSNAKVLFVISGTEENHLIKNKFIIDINNIVNPPKPKLLITKAGERLHFQAIIPRDFLAPQCLKYKFVYTKCNEQSNETTINSSLHVEYDPACKYAVQVQVIYFNYCGGDHDIGSEMSEQEYYGEDSDPNLAFKVAIIVIPSILCCCLVAAILIFRRIKDIILPKIPEPSLFFKDILNSTSDGLSKSLSGGKLYVPVKEVVASGVTLEPKSALLPQNHDTCT